MAQQFEIDNFKTKYSKKGKVLLVVSHYLDNLTPSLQILDATTGEPLCTASVNPHIGKVTGDRIAIKGWSENEGIEDALLRAKLIVEDLEYDPIFPCGYEVAQGYTMIGSLLEAWNAHKKEMGWS